MRLNSLIVQGILIILILTSILSLSSIVQSMAVQSIPLITNINCLRFTVTWITEIKAVGAVHYGKTPALGNMAYDVRGDVTSGKIHYITISNLDPDTLYYFDIINNGVVDDNQGKHYISRTANLPSSPPIPDNRYGTVVMPDGKTPAKDTLIFINIQDNDNLGSPEYSTVLSSLVEENGWWSVQLTGAWKTDLSDFFSFSLPGDTIHIKAVASYDLQSEMALNLSTTPSFPTLKLDQVSVDCYLDSDGDEYGDPNQSIQASLCPEGYVENNTDCNDLNYFIYPGSPELCDGEDNDCDEAIPDHEADTDDDGIRICEHDCDDNDQTRYPGAQEICDWKDNDCDGDIDEEVCITFDMNLPAGWSMISLPVIPDNTSLLDLFPKAIVVYGYKKGMGYVRKEDGLKVGEGYWILLDKKQDYTLTGSPIDKYIRSIYEDGWYLIGGCTLLARASANRSAIGGIYRYVQGVGYQQVLDSENLKPGKGYWILLRNIVDQAELMVKTSGF